MKTENIKAFLQSAYSDEKLAALLAHAQDGKLAYNSCCCFIGVSTADHALEIGREKRGVNHVIPDIAHIYEAKLLPYADAAEVEFCGLGRTDEERRREIIPLILAEMERRELLRTLPDLPLSEQLRLEEEAAAEPQITERQRIDAAMNVYSRRSFSVSSTFDPASDPRFA